VRASSGAVDRRTLHVELLLVFALSLGAEGLFALIQLLADVTSGRSLASQQAVLVAPLAPGRPWLDLVLQVVSIGLALVPVALAAHFLSRSGESLATLGLDLRHRVRDGLSGAGLAALVGGVGLGFYLGTHALGIDLTVVPESLPGVWWRIPVLLLAAAQDGILEETLVAGYLLHRLDQLGWRPRRALVASALLRGSYHLYQGLGGFAGNLVMGLLFGWLFQRWRRVTPLIVAHTLIDAGAFVGYVLLAGHVSWLPIPPRR
jgi:membrane protease YdiL (CAAX protease family)